MSPPLRAPRLGGAPLIANAMLAVMLIAAPVICEGGSSGGGSGPKDDSELQLAPIVASGDELVTFDTSTEPACYWGGYNITDYPWARSRAADMGEWFCNITGQFRDEAEAARHDGKVCVVGGSLWVFGCGLSG